MHSFPTSILKEEKYIQFKELLELLDHCRKIDITHPLVLMVQIWEQRESTAPAAAPPKPNLASIKDGHTPNSVGALLRLPEVEDAAKGVRGIVFVMENFHS